MRCPYCYREVVDEWNYCPYCGEPLKKKSIFEEIEEEIGRIFGRKKKAKIEEIREEKWVPIKIEDTSEEKNIKRKVSKVVEPKVIKYRKGDKYIYEIEMPGIKSLEDISIQRFEESIEVRGYTDDTCYFALIKLGKNYKIVDKRLEKDKLILEVQV